MNEKLENIVRMLLREASSFGARGLGFDFEKGDINEDWKDFENSAIEEISIPASVLEIGDRAFYNASSLASVEIFEGLQSIGASAFYGTALEEFKIPASLKELGFNPFGGNENFSGFEIADGNNFFAMENGVLYNYEKTVLIIFPVNYTGEYVMPNTLTELVSGAFSGTYVTSVTIGTGITEIPLELQFVEVIAATTKTGSDVDEEFNEESELPSTVTLLVSEEQSKMLADLEKTGTIHMSLVYRGDRKTAEEFLQKQKELNEELKAEAEGTANPETEATEPTGESEAVGDETQ